MSLYLYYNSCRENDHECTDAQSFTCASWGARKAQKFRVQIMSAEMEANNSSAKTGLPASQIRPLPCDPRWPQKPQVHRVAVSLWYHFVWDNGNMHQGSTTCTDLIKAFTQVLLYYTILAPFLSKARNLVLTLQWSTISIPYDCYSVCISF